LAKYRKVQHDLEESEERADQAENAMAKFRAKGRTSSSLTKTVVGGGGAAVSTTTSSVSACNVNSENKLMKLKHMHTKKENNNKISHLLY